MSISPTWLGRSSRSVALVCAGALVAVAGATVWAPGAGAAGKAKTRVTIDSAFLATGDTHFAGDIFSPRKKCKNDRKVLVMRKQPGPDEKLGTTRSFQGVVDPGYFWTYAHPGAAPEGTYYAKVKRTNKCKADRSKDFPFNG